MEQVSKEKELEELTKFAELEEPTELKSKCFCSYTSFENQCQHYLEKNIF